MKKTILAMILLAALCAGCAAQETFETVEDVYVQPVSAPMQQPYVQLPADAATLTLQNADGGTLYFCDCGTVAVQTVPSGNLDSTLRSTTGYGKDQLQLMQTQSGAHKRYDCVWVAAGETGEQVGRLALIDDGSYHYVLSVMADATQAEAVAGEWRQMFDTFCLLSPDAQVSTGS